MSKAEEMLKEKGKDLENIKAPDDLEEKLREALDRKPETKRFNMWKMTAVAAALIMAIGLGSLNFVDLGKHTTTKELGMLKGGPSNYTVKEIKPSDPSNIGAEYTEPTSSLVNTDSNTVITGSSAAPLNKDIQLTYSESVTASNKTASMKKARSGKQNDKKIIKNANATIESKKAADAFDKVSKWVKANGGYEFSRNISSAGTDKQVTADFRISPDKLDEMLDFLNSIGKVKDSQVSSSDITDQYQDTDARLKAMKKGRDQMMKVMDKAKTVKDILEIQNELNDINADIESLQGQISLWDKQVAESSVSIAIFEEKDPLKPEEKVDWKFNSLSEVLNSMKNGFVNTVNNLFNVLIWILVFLSSSIPFVIIGAVLIFIIWRYIRKRRGHI